MKAIILAGGGGTRLWPLSTEENPKQFHKLLSDKTMIQETLDRLDFLAPEDIYIATNQKQAHLVQKNCTQIPQQKIIIEPDKRDTAPAMGLSATIIEHNHPGEVMAMISADHLIKNKTEFQEKLKQAEKVAQEQNTLNIVEVEATEPNTNYGYVKLGQRISDDLYHIDSFTEKPDLETAQEFLASGNYLWNTGMYVWKASTLLKHFQDLKPEMYKKFIQIKESLSTDKKDQTINNIYPTLEKISIDFAIMEKVDPQEIRIIKADLGWIDIGNWKTLYEQLQATANQESGEVKIIPLQEAKKLEEAGLRAKTKGSPEIIVIPQDGHFLIAKEDNLA